MGYIVSAFGWSYVIAQLPGGWLLERFGSKIVYALSNSCNCAMLRSLASSILITIPG
jgi:MFS family permease